MSFTCRQETLEKELRLGKSVLLFRMRLSASRLNVMTHRMLTHGRLARLLMEWVAANGCEVSYVINGT
jgi:hypothetical protein